MGGEEDLSYMGAKDWENIISYGIDMIPRLTEYIHIDTASNRNIYIPSNKEKLSLIYKGENWHLMNKKDLIKDIMYQKSNNIQNALDIYGAKFNIINSKRSQNILNLCITDTE